MEEIKKKQEDEQEKIRLKEEQEVNYSSATCVNITLN